LAIAGRRVVALTTATAAIENSGDGVVTYRKLLC
jgi:hypothetical protein